VTVPVGVPDPDCGVTATVNVTDWPYADGFKLEVRLVLVGPSFTT
jgi:hypothetical protein